MAFKILDRAKMSVVGSPSTGDVTLGAPLSGYQSFVQAGLLDGDTFAYSISEGTTWEFGIGTYTAAGTKMSRAVTKTNNQNATPLSFSSLCVVTAVLRAEDVAQATALSGLTDVGITPGAAIDGEVIYWNNAGGLFETKTIMFADLPDAPAIPANSSFLLSGLGDVSVVQSSGTNGYSLTWNNSTNRFVLTNVSGGGGGSSTLAGLSDVTLASPADGDVLTYVASASKWENKPASSGGGGPGGTAPTVVQFKATSVNGALPSLTMDAAPANGNLLIASVLSDTVSPSTGSGWTQLAASTPGTYYNYLYSKVAGASESATQTPVTGSGSGNVAVAIWEINGQASSNPVLVAAAISAQPSVTYMTTPVLAPPADTLYLAMIVSYTVSAVLSSIGVVTTTDGNLSSGPGARPAYGHAGSSSSLYSMSASQSAAANYIIAYAIIQH